MGRLRGRLGVVLVRSLVLSAVVALVLASACVPGKVASEIAVAPELDLEGQTKCQVKKSQQKPLIVEWPSAERVDLEANREEGPVVVRYDGCEMQLLTQCKAPGSYTYQSVSVKQDTIVITNEDELHASIPLYAAKFEGNLERSGQLNVAMTMVGRWKLSNPRIARNALTGDCAGATHVLSSLTVGAFEFFAGAEASVGAGVGVAGAGVGATSSAKRDTLTKDGDPARCTGARGNRPPEGCGALLRVRVTALKAPQAATAVVGPPPPPRPRPRTAPAPAPAPAPSDAPAPDPKKKKKKRRKKKQTGGSCREVDGSCLQCCDGVGPPPSCLCPATASYCYLNVKSKPSSSVTIDGSPAGHTPLIGFKVRAGSHTVVLKQMKEGRVTAANTRMVNCPAGKTVLVTVNFVNK